MPDSTYRPILRARMMGSIAILLLCMTSMNAQDKWADCLTLFLGSYYNLIEECGDIEIKGKEYTILTLTQYDHLGDELLGLYTWGYIRETADSVFIISNHDNPDSTECLLYTYNVEVGDTLQLDFCVVGGGGRVIVQEVDTITIFAEQRRRVRTLRLYNGAEDIWIEGIGSITHGYLWRGYYNQPQDLAYEFSCYYSGEHDTIWSPYDSRECLMELLDTSACEMLTSSTAPIETTIVTLYPNPFSWETHVVGIPSPCKLVAYDISGKVVMQSIVDSDETTINTAYLQSGMYYFVLIPENGNPITIKGVKM